MDVFRMSASLKEMRNRKIEVQRRKGKEGKWKKCTHLLGQ
jgi:hypothetical protein